MPARQPLEMPGRYGFHSTRPAPRKRVSAALSVDRQSKSGVNFRRTRGRCFSLWLSRSGKAREDRPGPCHTSSASFLGTPHRFATVAVRYAEGQLSTFGVAAVRAAISSCARKLLRARLIPAAPRLPYSSLEFNFALQRANDLSQLAQYQHPQNLLCCKASVRAAHRARQPLTSSHRRFAE